MGTLDTRETHTIIFAPRAGVQQNGVPRRLSGCAGRAQARQTSVLPAQLVSAIFGMSWPCASKDRSLNLDLTLGI